MITELRIFGSLVVDAFRYLLQSQPARRRYQMENEYDYPFTQEEKYAMVHKRVDQTLNDFLAPQYEQDQEEPPHLTTNDLIDEFQRVATLAREMGIPFIVGVQAPGYKRIYMSSNITPPQTDTQIMCAYHDLSR